MKYLLFLFLLVSTLSIAQNISLEFENTPMKEAILKIESQTDYQFFFVESWIDDFQVSGKYNNLTIAIILEDLLNSTDLNYYISGTNKIIFTKNNIIYNRLPDGFFWRIREKRYSRSNH